jgi:hypothetical protein
MAQKKVWSTRRVLPRRWEWSCVIDHDCLGAIDNGVSPFPRAFPKNVLQTFL